ncbi:MAG: NADH-quinone oxidoreductase subunit J [Rickettsiales bacterium]|jgi:NADH-quinone oxidoreductase subunit J|nr:NADH-quinone oxidoreductase subunit J [Rickettsiales bacterium]
MNFTLLLFYVFSIITIASSLAVVTTRNTIYSVLFLILVFFNASGLFILLNAEFLAMLLIIVYVGAIAVLFLFVVMMLNVDSMDLKKQIRPFLPILIMISITIFGEIFLFEKISTIENYQISTSFPINQNISNIKSIGNVLYTDFILPFQVSGASLFVAMIGAILLTLKNENKKTIKKQDIFKQISHNKTNSIELVKVESGKGINI